MSYWFMGYLVAHPKVGYNPSYKWINLTYPTNKNQGELTQLGFVGWATK